MTPRTPTSCGLRRIASRTSSRPTRTPTTSRAAPWTCSSRSTASTRGITPDAQGRRSECYGAPSGAPQATLDRLREALARAEFCASRLTAAGLGERIRPADDTFLLRTLAPDGALAALVALWVIGSAIDVPDAVAALAPATLDELAGAGLLVREGASRVRGAVMLQPHGDIVIASDRSPPALAEPPDMVPGVNPVGRLLARLTVRTQAATVLDLGTGNGMQALVAAARAGEVLATDVNPRALAYAELNARLNRITNVAFAAGSWFEPAAERSFDLILANPPFVVSPDAQLTYRDSGLGPGELSATLLRQAARRLQPGGFAHVTAEWGVPHGADWRAVPREWVAGTGCDALVLRHQLVDSLDHAVMWNQRLASVAPDRFEAAVERWTRHHRRHGFEALAAAVVVLRRRAGGPPPWCSELAVHHGAGVEAGEHVLRMFAGEDLVQAAGAGGRGLLAERLVPVDGLRIEQTLDAREARWRRDRARLRLPAGAGVEGRVDERVLDTVFALDGRRTLDDVIRDVAARRAADADALRAIALDEIPGLVRRGLVATVRQRVRQPAPARGARG